MAQHKFRATGEEERVYPTIVIEGDDGPQTYVSKPGETVEVEGLALADDVYHERVDRPRRRPSPSVSEPEPESESEQAAPEGASSEES